MRLSIPLWVEMHHHFHQELGKYATGKGKVSYVDNMKLPLFMASRINSSVSIMSEHPFMRWFSHFKFRVVLRLLGYFLGGGGVLMKKLSKPQIKLFSTWYPFLLTLFGYQRISF